MARQTKTEEDLGIATTEEEKAVIAAPDDYPEGGDPDPVVPDVPPEKPKDEPVKEPEKPEQPKPDKPPPGYVDQRALQESRAKERTLEERLNTLLEIVNRTTKAAEPKVEAPAKPDLLQNPMEFIDFGLKDVNERLAKIEGQTAEQQAAQQAWEQEQQAVEAALQIARPQFDEAAAADPTLQPLYNALRISLGSEIAWQHHIPTDNRMTPAQAQFLQRKVGEIENAHIRYAVENGINAAEHVRGFAASRGVTPQMAQPPAQEPKTIAQRQQAQQRHMSLSDAPGSEVPAKISAKDIAKMSPKQFAAFAAKVGDTGLDELMGGSGTA